MIDKDRLDKGLYWQRSWKLVEGCEKVSPGCANCWSEQETIRFSQHFNVKIYGRACQVLSFDDADRPIGFAGNVLLRTDNLGLPLRVKKPTVFAIWNDLYHQDVPDEFRDRAYAVMALCPQHVFLVLTKRPERMAKYWGEDRVKFGVRIWKASPFTKYGKRISAIVCANIQTYGLLNVWHGVTAEKQEQADLRIPHLLRVPGKRFLSIEPMLGPVDLSRINFSKSCQGNILEGCGIDRRSILQSIPNFFCETVHAVLLGGESGKNARPVHPDWARTVRDQCQTANVPFFFKQWGEWFPVQNLNDLPNPPARKVVTHRWSDAWGDYSCRVGKRAAGRTLDGRKHDDLPWVKP